jgi:hypothetical protein
LEGVLEEPDEELPAPGLPAVLDLIVLPAKALAATSESTPVNTTLPAISQRLVRLSR